MSIRVTIALLRVARHRAALSAFILPDILGQMKCHASFLSQLCNNFSNFSLSPNFSKVAKLINSCFTSLPTEMAALIGSTSGKVILLDKQRRERRREKKGVKVGRSKSACTLISRGSGVNSAVVDLHV